jgi:hypothetical protein
MVQTTAEPPTLNDTAPPVNLMADFTHFLQSKGASAPSSQSASHAQTSSTGTTQTGAPTPLSSIDLSGVVPVAFTLMFIVWGIFSLVIIYHWFRYRHKSWFAVPAIALHIFVSGWIIIYMVNALT